MDIRQIGPGTAGAPAPQSRPAASAPAAPAAPAAEASAAVTAPPPAAPDRHQLEAVVKELNKTIASMNTGIEFSIDHDTKTTVVKVIDQSTKEVLRQIPSEETLQISKALDKLQGLLIKHEA